MGNIRLKMSPLDRYKNSKVLIHALLGTKGGPIEPPRPPGSEDRWGGESNQSKGRRKEDDNDEIKEEIFKDIYGGCIGRKHHPSQTQKNPCPGQNIPMAVIDSLAHRHPPLYRYGKGHAGCG